MLQENGDDEVAIRLREELIAKGGEESEQSLRGRFVVEIFLVRLRVIHAAPEIDTADASLAQNPLRVFDCDVIEQKIGREITAGNDHPLREIGNFRRPSDQPMQRRITVRLRVDAKERLIDRAPEAVPDVQSVVRAKAALVERFRDREENGHLDGAGGVKAAVGIDRETEPGLVVEQRDRVSHRLAFVHDAFARLPQHLAFLVVVHDRWACYLQWR